MMPSSNNIHMGNASMICEITSGGVSSIPITKAPTIMYGRFSISASAVVIPVAIRIMVATGTSNASPKAKNIARIKSRYLLISVIIATPSGATPIRKLKTSGKTTK